MYKKLLVFILILLMCLSLSIATDWTKSMEYENEDLTVVMKNWWGLGAEQGRMTLTSHRTVNEIKSVGIGWQVVMTYDFEFNEDLENALGDVTFIDMKTGEEVEKDWYFVSWEEVEKSKEVCLSYESVSNLTSKGYNEVCSKYGTETYYIYEWVEYSSKNIYKGKQTLGIMVYNNHGDYVDGIWNIGSKSLDRHATWTSNLNEGLVRYYSFEGVGTDLVGKYNMTANDPQVWGSSGIIGEGADFSNGNDELEYLSDVDWVGNKTGSRTINMWVYLPDWDDILTSNRIHTQDSNIDGSIIFTYTGTMTFSPYGNTYPTFIMNGKGYTGWQMVTGVIDKGAGESRLYINGSLVDTESFTALTHRDWGEGEFSAFGRQDGVPSFDGKVDEAGYWTRALSVSELEALYNNGLGLTYRDTTISLVLPLNNNYYDDVTEIKYLNNMVNGNECWYDLNGVTSSKVSAGVNFTNVNSRWGYNNLALYCDDILSNVYTDSARYYKNYNLTYIQNQTKNYITEEETNHYELNLYLDDIGINFSSTNATLVWNNTYYYPQKYSYTDHIRFVKELDAPSGTGSPNFGNITWYWLYNLQTSTYIVETNTTSHQNTSVYAMDLDDCSTYTSVILNFSLYDEEDLTRINGTIETNIELKSLGSLSQILNASFSIPVNKTTSSIFCVPNLSLNLSSYYLSTITRYYGSDHEVEYHYIDDYLLDNHNMQRISLYSLATTDSTSFIVNYQDQNFLAVQDATLDLFRYYVDEGQWRSVEHAKTDEGGQTRLHFVTEDVKYKVYVRVGGQTVYTTSNFLALCQITPCTLSIRRSTSTGGLSDYDKIGNLDYSFTVNESSQTALVTFVTNDGSSGEIKLDLVFFNAYENDTVCSNTLSASGGSVSCSLPLDSVNGTYIAKVYFNNQWIDYGLFQKKPTPYDNFGGTGVILAFIIVLSLVVMTLGNNIITVITAVTTVVLLGVINVIDTGSIFGLGSSIIYLIVAGMILIWKIQQRRNS